MLRRIVLSLAIVLLVSTGAFAGITQLQEYIVGATNGIVLEHGHQNGDGSHTICINNDQCAEKICGAWANQTQAALLNQIGSACGDCAVINVGQIFDAYGAQTQAIGDCVEPMLQGQSSGLAASQIVAKSGGQGAGNATHAFVGNQSQAAANPLGAMRESSSVGAFQSSALQGSPGATGVVTSSMSVSTMQAQAID